MQDKGWDHTHQGVAELVRELSRPPHQPPTPAPWRLLSPTFQTLGAPVLWAQVETPEWLPYITLLTKVHMVKAMIFLVVMYGHESWTIKKAEHQRIGAFKLWCWGNLFRVPWTGRRSNQPIVKKINLKYSLEGLKLKLQYFGHLVWRANSLEKTPMLGMIESGRKKRGQQRMR